MLHSCKPLSPASARLIKWGTTRTAITVLDYSISKLFVLLISYSFLDMLINTRTNVLGTPPLCHPGFWVFHSPILTHPPMRLMPTLDRLMTQVTLVPSILFFSPTPASLSQLPCVQWLRVSRGGNIAARYTPPPTPNHLITSTVWHPKYPPVFSLSQSNSRLLTANAN